MTVLLLSHFHSARPGERLLFIYSSIHLFIDPISISRPFQFLDVRLLIANDAWLQPLIGSRSLHHPHSLRPIWPFDDLALHAHDLTPIEPPLSLYLVSISQVHLLFVFGHR